VVSLQPIQGRPTGKLLEVYGDSASATLQLGVVMQCALT
jgi:hypothetical protein